MIVVVGGIKHEVGSLAEARALCGVQPKPKAKVWASEANGTCNRCHGTGRYYGHQSHSDTQCYRCHGTGVAPGHKPTIEVEEVILDLTDKPQAKRPILTRVEEAAEIADHYEPTEFYSRSSVTGNMVAKDHWDTFCQPMD